MELKFDPLLTILQINLALNTKKADKKRELKQMEHIRESQVEENIVLSQRTIEKCQTHSALLFDDVLKLSKAINGENHTLTGKVYQNIGSNHLMRDEYKEALQSFERAL
jgi:hypothetical protein